MQDQQAGFEATDGPHQRRFLAYRVRRIFFPKRSIPTIDQLWIATRDDNHVESPDKKSSVTIDVAVGIASVKRQADWEM